MGLSLTPEFKFCFICSTLGPSSKALEKFSAKHKTHPWPFSSQSYNNVGQLSDLGLWLQSQGLGVQFHTVPPRQGLDLMLLRVPSSPTILRVLSHRWFCTHKRQMIHVFLLSQTRTVHGFFQVKWPPGFIFLTVT